MLHSHLLSMDSAAVTNALPPFNSNIHMSERKLIRLILEMIRNESQADSFVTTTKKTLIPYRDSQNYQRDALLYIVVVLFFYSVSLAVCMIKYMRKEAEESKDSQFTQEVIQNSRRLALQEERLENARKLVTRLNQSPTLQGRNMSFQLEVNPTQKNPSRKATLTPRISIQINDEVDQLQCSDVPMPMRRDSRSVHSSISSLNSSSGWDHGVTLMAGVTETSFLLSRTGKLLIDRTVSNDTTISDDENSSGHYKSPQLEERKAFIPKKSMKKVAFSPISPV